MGSRIKELREAREMTQQDLAIKTGLAMRTIAYAEAGRDIKSSTLWLIADALGVSVDDLFEKASA
jgi:transcriptional regulator with XRE-family HTH domain